MTSLQQPYFLECNRNNSTILSENANYNAIWSSDISPFQLLPGDQVSVSSVAIEASSIGTPDTIEFTGEPVKVNNVPKEYVDNKVVLEIGFYLLNANGSHTCVLPLRFPSAYKDITANYRLAVNDATTEFIGAPTMPGFTEKGTVGFNNPGSKYVFYEGVDTSGNVLPQTGQNTYLTKIILSQPGDPNPNGFLLVDYPTDYNGNTGNFRAMEGMGLQTEGVGNIVYDLGIVEKIDVSGGRIVLELEEPALAAFVLQPSAPSVNGSPVTFYVNYPNDNREIGLMNADMNDYSTPAPTFKVERGNILFDMTKYLGNSTEERSPIYYKSFNLREGFSNTPYILSRQDYQGTQVSGNAMKMSPLLQPMTVFVTLSATEIFEDCNRLAERIEAQLREVSTIFGLNEQSKEIIDENTTYKKSNQINRNT